MITFIENLFKKYPSLLSAVLSVAVAVGVKLGFTHLTTTELLSVISAAIAFIHMLSGVGVVAGRRDAVEDFRRSASLR